MNKKIDCVLKQCKGMVLEISCPEASGKTTMALHILSKCQKEGKRTAFLDLENAFDPSYAEKLGVKVDELLLNQPDSGEQALDVVEKLCQSNAVSVIVLDSVAQLQPQAVLNKEIDGTANIGTTARLLSQTLPRISSAAARSGTTLIFINQIRMKIGEMFEWPSMYKHFLHDCLLNTQKSSLKIGQIVSNRLKIKILTFNENNKNFEFQEIQEYIKLNKIQDKKDVIYIQTFAIDSRGGRFGVPVTSDQRLYTPEGWKKANELALGDKLVSRYQSKINGSLKEFLNGVFIGDCTLRGIHNTACIAFQDNKNKEYVKWKVERLSPFYNFKSYKINTGVKWESNFEYELRTMSKIFINRNPIVMFNEYSDLSLAIWIMDDAHFDNKGSHKRYILSAKRFKNTSVLNEVSNQFKKLGFENSIYSPDGSIRFTREASCLIASRIAKYVPACMAYKLPTEFQGQYVDLKLFNNPIEIMEYVSIVSIRNASNKQMRSSHRYLVSNKNGNCIIGGKTNGIVASCE